MKFLLSFGGGGKLTCLRDGFVITLLSRLVEKGLLKTNKVGRRNEYTAVVSETDYQTAQLAEGNAAQAFPMEEETAGIFRNG